ncbi:MAG: helicase C-terminal domain-containing protein [Actinomycetota bacterium]|nr:helicase C-terminal domain-containing protein [Actinomycetota bacterium]
MDSDALSRFLVPGTDSDVAEEYAVFAARARDTVFGFEEEIAFVDIETTGFDVERDAIIEVAAAIARGPEIVARFSTFVNPGREIPPEITKLTGIDGGMVEGAPSPEAAALDVAEFVAGRDIVAHNVGFDRKFLEAAAGASRFSGAWIDSLQLAVISLPRLRSHRLSDLATAFDAPLPSHRATDDVEALAFLWRVMLCGLAALPAGLAARISHLAPSAAWPLRLVIAHIAAGARASAFDLKESRRRTVSADRADALFDAEEIECACPPIDEVVAEFALEGLAGRMYPEFERRDEQAAMATAVTEAFASGTHAAIEAGTGVGKSIAYLVPAARFALRNGVGVGVATKTNSLMDQLIYSELPALCRALEGELRYVSLKGYEHYACLRKLERFAAELDDTADEMAIVTAAALLTWVAQTSWGDLDSTNIHWRRETRAALAASIADCTHKRCRFYPHLCYLHGVRRRAASAHIVVTNHALLFRDVVASGGILPPIRHWIVDEAHSAESEARKQLTFGASHVELSAALGTLVSKGRGGLLENLRRTLRNQPAEHQDAVLGEIAKLEHEATTGTTLADSLFDFVKDLGETVRESGYDMCDLRVTRELRESGAWGTVAGVGGSLVRRLEAAIEHGRKLVLLLEAESTGYTDPRADLIGLLSRLADQKLGLEMVLDGEADEYVYSATLDRRRNTNPEKLVASRLDIGEALAEELYPRTKSVVFTSATIATGDDFSHFARAVGLGRLPDDAWAALRLESSYDFERQMAVFVASDLPEPRDSQYLPALESLLEQVHLAMGGSTLTLFTNRRDMERLYRALEPRLDREGVPLLVQGRGVSAKRLRDEFIADESLSLFATKSFWEGFDAKGDTLRCVVVPKLPFGRPTDPLAEEREAREGRVAWRRYTLPEAVIELKQAAGRLIRSSTDVGCLVVADVRVVRQAYGRDFIESLPVRDIEVLPAEEIVSEIARRFGRSQRDGMRGS